jgi:uncharacterized membrane protein
VIKNPLLLAVVFFSVVAGLDALKRWGPAERVFRLLPMPFWCYFLPTLAGTAGLFPAESVLYVGAGKYVLPLCLALLLVNVDLPGLARLGRPALLAMGLGAGGVALGAVAGYALLRDVLPPESWKAVGALSASWIGGSANMLAVKEALSAPEGVFAPIIVVDTLFAYAWMAGLIFLAPRQSAFDRWAGARNSSAGSADGLLPSTDSPAPSWPRPYPWPAPLLVAVLLGVSAPWLAGAAGPTLSSGIARVWPSLGASFSPATWSVLFVTTAALTLAWTGRWTAGAARTERGGTFLLYLLLTTLGARARLGAVVQSPGFLALGAIILTVHGATLFLGGRWAKLPLFLLASSSQACVGGTVSAPLVAAVYQPALSAVGLLLAVLGNVLGTYVGLLIAKICGSIS